MHIKKSKKDIFISYCRKACGIETAGRISDRLQSLGYTVFMDLPDMKVGEAFPPQIKTAIQSCKEVLLVLPPDAEDEKGNMINALESRWVKAEICNAIKYDKKIIPIQMEGYKFPREESYPEVPKEFKELPKVIEKFEKLNELDGIQWKTEYFDQCFEKLRKSLNSRPKWNVRKKIMIPMCAILSLILLLIVGKCIYNSYLPLFSLSLITDENSDNESDNQSWNIKYLVTNKGGQLSGGKVSPKQRIGFKVVSKYLGEKYKYGFFDVEFYDFYEDGYFFDDQNNTVSIFETKSDSLMEFIYLMEELLEKKDMYIEMYTIKTVFKIEYTDRFRVNHTEYFESENNYNYLYTGWGADEEEDNKDEGIIRYYEDNTLVSMQNIDDAYFACPLFSPDIPDFKSSVKRIVKDINKDRKKILPTNIDDVWEAEDFNGNAVGVLVENAGYAEEVIHDDYGFGIGIHMRHKNCEKRELEWYEKLINFVSDIWR